MVRETFRVLTSECILRGFESVVSAVGRKACGTGIGSGLRERGSSVEWVKRLLRASNDDPAQSELLELVDTEVEILTRL